jgi:hypothetical protein
VQDLADELLCSARGKKFVNDLKHRSHVAGDFGLNVPRQETYSLPQWLCRPRKD